VADATAETIFDVVVIGSGPGGYTAAFRGAELGLKVAMIEKDDVLGGTCLHVGCIPTKALLFNAEIWLHVQNGTEFGIDGAGGATLNWTTVQARKNAIIVKHTKGLEFLAKKHKVARFSGYARLTGPSVNGVHIVELDTGGARSQVKAKNVILATGSEARMLAGLKPDDRILTNIEILSLPQPPKSLIVIGALRGGRHFQRADAALQKAGYRCEHRRQGRDRREDRHRRQGDFYRLERQDPGEGSRKSSGSRWPPAAHRGHRHRENQDRA
jgi:dihydrolipoamide dehydrogenase